MTGGGVVPLAVLPNRIQPCGPLPAAPVVRADHLQIDHAHLCLEAIGRRVVVHVEAIILAGALIFEVAGAVQVGVDARWLVGGRIDRALHRLAGGGTTDGDKRGDEHEPHPKR